ncbi:MAG: hypothetical protein ABIT06_00555 [Saprospiraceae bacterium]
MSVGQFNDSIASSQRFIWVETDPLFYLGNGTAVNNLHNAMVVYKNGNMVLKNPYIVNFDPGLVAVPISGSGTRMMWLPEKSAFRAGSVETNAWDADNIGTWSFASGFSTKAKGVISTALGMYTSSKAMLSVSIGRFNDEIFSSSPTSWVATDPLFSIGNGTSGAPSNAVVIYKNGNSDFNGHMDIDGFTKMGVDEGAPAIKMKKLTGTSSATHTWVNIAHGLTQSKIIAVSIIMNIPGFVNLPPSYTYQAGYQYEYQIASSDIVVINSTTNSGNILSKPFTILITYEQ